MLKQVYPACAGIHLNFIYWHLLRFGLPRMRGDPPLVRPHDSPAWTSTPHARGSTCSNKAKNGQIRVYPACAGIHLSHIAR